MDEIRQAIEYMKEYFKGKSVNGVELGVFEGRNALRLLNNLNIGMLYLIDIWEPKYYDIPKDYYSIVEKLFENSHNISIFREKTSQAVNRFFDNTLDFVYVDADHSYKGCKEDIELWYPKLKEKGILTGHDYYAVPDVKKAVDEFVIKNNFKLILFDSISIFDNVKYGEWLIIK